MKSRYTVLSLLLCSLFLVACPSRPVKQSGPFNDADTQNRRANDSFKELDREVNK